MTHDFDPAIKAVNEWGADLVECPFTSEIQLANYIETVQFALRFTKSALSGEVSDGVKWAAEAKRVWHSTTCDCGVVTSCGTSANKRTELFKAMCQQLAKEIG